MLFNYFCFWSFLFPHNVHSKLLFVHKIIHKFCYTGLFLLLKVTIFFLFFFLFKSYVLQCNSQLSFDLRQYLKLRLVQLNLPEDCSCGVYWLTYNCGKVNDKAPTFVNLYCYVVTDTRGSLTQNADLKPSWGWIEQKPVDSLAMRVKYDG